MAEQNLSWMKELKAAAPPRATIQPTQQPTQQHAVPVELLTPIETIELNPAFRVTIFISDPRRHFVMFQTIRRTVAGEWVNYGPPCRIPQRLLTTFLAALSGAGEALAQSTNAHDAARRLRNLGR